MRSQLLSWLLALAIRPTDRVEPPEARSTRLEIVADAILTASGGDPQLAAALAVDGAGETGYSLAWGNCQCRGQECDFGRALGYWQHHLRHSEPLSARETLCGTQSPQVTIGAERAARYLRGCFRGDQDCLARRFALLGGIVVHERVPVWAMDRAIRTVRLAERLKE